MKYKKILGCAMILGVVGNNITNSAGVFASEKLDHVPINTEYSMIKSQNTEPSQITKNIDFPQEIKGNTSDQIVIGDWVVDTTPAGTLKLVAYTGSQINVVIPTAKDLNHEGELLEINKDVLRSIATKTTTSSIQISQNGDPIKFTGTDLSAAFAKCDHLESIRLSGLDTSGVVNMEQMFYKCPQLKTIDFSDISTAAVSNMEGMFANCNNLDDLNLSSFDTSKVEDMHGMFQDCTSLNQLNIMNWNTSNVKDMFAMFQGCVSIQNLEIYNFSTSEVTDMSAMFANCHALTHINWNSQTFDTSEVTDMSDMFLGCNELATIDLSQFKTPKVENMKNMFGGCTNLQTLDISQLATSEVTDMSGMFNSCKKLELLDISHFDTRKVENMSGMFNACESLQVLNVSHFDTTHVRLMGSMFKECAQLLDLDLSGFDTYQVTSFKSMFSGCKSLSGINLSSLNTTSSRDLSEMFANCASLIKLDLSNFNTSSVTTLQGMFRGCDNLSDLSISSFDTSNVTNMQELFAFSPKLYHLDLKNFDCTKSDTRNMFLVSQETPLLISSSDIKLRAYNYNSDKRIPPVGVQSGIKGEFKSTSVFHQLFPLCIISQDFSNFDSTLNNPWVKKQLPLFKKQIQKSDPNYVITGWDYEEGETNNKIDREVTSSYIAHWEPKITLNKVKFDQRTGDNFGEKDLRANVKILLNEEGKNVLTTDREKIVITATNSNGQVIQLSKITKNAGTYTVNYSYEKANVKLKIQVHEKVTPIVQFTVNFKALKGGELTGKTSIKVNKNSHITNLPGVKPHQGYAFDGWYNMENQKVNPKAVNITSNTSFNAKFIPNVSHIVSVYRLYNKVSMQHLYTANKNEYNMLPIQSKDWVREGVNYYEYSSKGKDKKAVNRVYNPKSGEHLYTSDAYEVKVLTSRNGWKSEGVAFYTPLKSSKPVYRVFNPAAGIGAHFVTGDKYEKDVLVHRNWKYEGIAWYAINK